MNAKMEAEAWTRALAATIRAESAALGLRDPDMVKATGIGSTTYWRIQKGERPPSVYNLRLIAGALGLTLDQILDLADARATEAPIRRQSAQEKRASARQAQIDDVHMEIDHENALMDDAARSTVRDERSGLGS